MQVIQISMIIVIMILTCDSFSHNSLSKYNSINVNDNSIRTSIFMDNSDIRMSMSTGRSMIQPHLPSSITASTSFVPTSSSNENNNIDNNTINPTIINIDPNIKKDIAILKNRLEKLEKDQLRLSSAQTQKSTAVTTFIDSLAASTLAMNARTVELCAIIGFFGIGVIVGTSLLDRLWLLGGIGAAWWASGAVHRDTRGGSLARRVGVQLAQLIRDIQEKINQAIIFYRTGKLGYVSWKWWDQYDTKFGVTRKVDEFKRLAMLRYTEFNTQLEGYHWTDQVSDIWKAMQSAPAEAQKINNRYGLTNRIVNFSKNIASAGVSGVKRTINFGKELFRDPDDNKRSSLKYKNYGRRKNSFPRYALSKNRSSSSSSSMFDFGNLFGNNNRNNKKGNDIFGGFFRSFSGNKKINQWSLPKFSSKKRRWD